MGEPSKTTVWRWKGTRADIVRIATAVAQQTGAPLQPFRAEVVDSMGKSDYRSPDELAAGLQAHESFSSLGIVGGLEGGPCRVIVYFAQSGVSAAGATVLTEGADPAAVQRTHHAISAAVRVGAREPKDVEPSTFEAGAGIFSICFSLLGVALLYFGFEQQDYELTLGGIVFFSIGTLAAGLWLGYDLLIPQIELLHPGQSPRIVKFGAWFASAVAGIFLTAALGLS